MDSTLVPSGGGWAAIPMVAAAAVVVIEPTRCDAVAFVFAAVGAVFCYGLTSSLKERALVRLSWVLATLVLGTFSPRTLSNREWIQDTYADFALSAFISSAFLPILFVAIFGALGRRSEALAETAVHKAAKKLGIEESATVSRTRIESEDGPLMKVTAVSLNGTTTIEYEKV